MLEYSVDEVDSIDDVVVSDVLLVSVDVDDEKAKSVESGDEVDVLIEDSADDGHDVDVESVSSV